MCEVMPNSADWDDFKILILLGDLKDSKLTSEGILSFSEVERSYQLVRCARSKLPSHTVPVSQRQHSYTPVCAWMVYPLWTCGI